MKNRYLLAGLLALAIIAGTVECPAAPLKIKPATTRAQVTPAPTQTPAPEKLYRAADIEAIKEQLRRGIVVQEMYAGLLPEGKMYFVGKAEGLDQTLESLEKLTPVTK